MEFTPRQLEHQIKSAMLPCIETNLFQHFKTHPTEQISSFTEEFENIIKIYIESLKKYFYLKQHEEGLKHLMDHTGEKLTKANENYGKIKGALYQLENIYKTIKGIKDMIISKEEEINNIKIKHASFLAQEFSIDTEIQIIRMKHYENSLNEECDFLEHKVKEHTKTFDNLDLAIRPIKEKLNNLYTEIHRMVKEFIEKERK